MSLTQSPPKPPGTCKMMPLQLLMDLGPDPAEHLSDQWCQVVKPRELTEERWGWRTVMISWVTLQTKLNKHDVMVITASAEEGQFALTEGGDEVYWLNAFCLGSITTLLGEIHCSSCSSSKGDKTLVFSHEKVTEQSIHFKTRTKTDLGMVHYLPCIIYSVWKFLALWLLFQSEQGTC